FRGWDPAAPTRIFAVSDDPEVGPPAGREGPLAALLEDELRRLGWRLGEQEDADQHLVVLAATPRGWKGRSGPGRQASEEARALARAAPRGAVVLLGHARWLPEFGTPAIGAWSTESLMERAAGRWLHAAVSSP
ncbi:MAG: hypothetical protein R3266_11540, partial [Gemmatimonadota bacterium]|nr:hypothetical protein [Gemmatimonadota bacterium]